MFLLRVETMVLTSTEEGERRLPNISFTDAADNSAVIYLFVGLVSIEISRL